MVNDSMIPIAIYRFSIGMTDRAPQVKDKPRPKPSIRPEHVQPVVQRDGEKQPWTHVPQMNASQIYMLDFLAGEQDAYLYCR